MKEKSKSKQTSSRKFPPPQIEDITGKEIPRLADVAEADTRMVKVLWINGSRAQFDMGNKRPYVLLVATDKGVAAIGQGYPSDHAKMIQKFLSNSKEVMEYIAEKVAGGGKHDGPPN